MGAEFGFDRVAPRTEGSTLDQEHEILRGVENMKNLLAVMLCFGVGILFLGCSGDAGSGGGESGVNTSIPSPGEMANEGEDGDATDGDAAEGEAKEGDAAEGEAKEGEAKEEAK